MDIGIGKDRAVEIATRVALLGGGLLLTALLLAVPAASQTETAPALKAGQRTAAIPPLIAAKLMQVAEDRVLTGDQTVAAGESVGDIVVVGGTLRVFGDVTGDAVVVGGDLMVGETGRVLGDALVTGGSILNEGGEIRGEMRTLEGNGEVSQEIRRAIVGGATAAATGREAAQAAREITREQRSEPRQRSWFDPIRRGVAGLISTLALGLVLAAIGAALIFYGRSNLDTVSDTLRSSVSRSLAVGLAAGFLIVPAFVIVVVALAVTIIGIPLLIVAIPLYPLAIAAAITLGLLAAAHAIGERTAEQSDSFRLSGRNAYSYLLTGLSMLLAPLFIAHLIGMTGFLGFIGTLLKFVTWAVIWAAATAGFGAVILSRGGTRRTFVKPMTPEAAFDSDPFFDEEPTPRGPRV